MMPTVTNEVCPELQCVHDECHARIRLALQQCYHCGERIGLERQFCKTAVGLIHWECLESPRSRRLQMVEVGR